MQTFLPYDDFHDSLESLDNKRLGKQRIEALQLLKALAGETTGWKNHPAARMWKGYEAALTDYMNVCIAIWVSRGFKNTMSIIRPAGPVILPPWFGDFRFHVSHQSNLVRKQPRFYGPQFPGVADNLPYFWPM